MEIRYDNTVQTPDDTWKQLRLINRHAPTGGYLYTTFRFPVDLLKRWGERDYRYLDRWINDLENGIKDLIDEIGQ